MSHKHLKEHHGHIYEGDGKQKHNADGSHQHSHKQLGGHRANIHEGMPSELEQHHNDKGDRS